LRKVPRPSIKDYDDAVEMVLQDQVHALVADYQICLVSLFRHPNQDLVSIITPLPMSRWALHCLPAIPI
jgi:hypothetical protein